MLFPLYNDFRGKTDELTSPEQQRALERILDCREKQKVDGCSSCKFYDDCDLVKGYLKQYAGPKTPQPDGGTP